VRTEGNRPDGIATFSQPTRLDLLISWPKSSGT